MDVQQSELRFFIPVVAAYFVPTMLLLWLVLRTKFWPEPEDLKTDRRWLDLGLALLAAVAVLAVGQLYRQGLLLEVPDDSGLAAPVWMLNNLIIYSPLFIVLALRRQSLATAFISPKGLWVKLGLGVAGALLAVLIFHLLRGEAALISVTLGQAFTLDSLSNFLAVFLEGVGLAFLYVRLRWVMGYWPAALIPALLFAAAHVPGSLAEGDALMHIAAFFLFNTAFVVAILAFIARLQDVIWLSVVHYFMDVAIHAFNSST
jgi:hypothetical protein